jgi:DNA-binding CsgD family transcriptional regulator
MLRADAIRSAAADVVSAALLGDGWEAALSTFSHAAGARGASLLRSRDRKVVGVIASPEIKQPVADYMAGRIPPPSRQVRALHDGAVTGFRLDHDDYTDEQLARDPYYQDFLRPHGFFWHAAVALDFDPTENVGLSLKRLLKSGPYERHDAVVLNSVLPELRAALRIARRVMDAEGAGVARLLQRRGAPVFELDAWGRVLRTHVFDEDRNAPIRVMRDRLIAVDRLAQPALDRAVARGVAFPGLPAIVPLPDDEGESHFLQIVPVGGRARDVFLAAAAVAVLIGRKPSRQRVAFDRTAIRDVFTLTDREAEVAILLGEGLSPVEIAERLRIQVYTARDHLKSIFEKTSTSRQAEFVALLGRLMP